MPRTGTLLTAMGNGQWMQQTGSGRRTDGARLGCCEDWYGTGKRLQKIGCRSEDRCS